jgi:hypothetical protein
MQYMSDKNNKECGLVGEAKREWIMILTLVFSFYTAIVAVEDASLSLCCVGALIRSVN